MRYVELIFNSYTTLHGIQSVKYITVVFVCFWRDSPQWAQGLLIDEVSR